MDNKQYVIEVQNKNDIIYNKENHRNKWMLF